MEQMDVMKRIQRIKDKITAANKWPVSSLRRDLLFGEFGQLLRESGRSLGPCLSPGEVGDFESRHGIRIPDEYRAFLLEVGNGGLGPPYYGLAVLGERLDTFDAYTINPTTGGSRLARPFPFTRSWIMEDGVPSDEGTTADLWNGCLYLGTDGCGMTWRLVVTGPDRGVVWNVDGIGIGPTCPKRDFLTWYESWLDGDPEWKR
jgi:hypothetical protein